MGRPRGGILFVVSAPSGTGKSTIARDLLKQVPGLRFSVSYTTRPPRQGERDGEDYHFIDRDRFQAMRDAGAFLEWANVFGELYGTGIDETRRALEQGHDLLLDIDVQGAEQVREGPIPSVSVMMLPPDYATLRDRLEARGTEANAEAAGRLGQAREEAEAYRHFDYLLVNDELERTVAGLAAIVHAERQRTDRCEARADEILATFPAVPRTP